MIVVTGATGNTGSEVVKHLLAKSQKVRAIGRSEERLQPFAANGVDPFVADITDFASLTKAFRDATAVYLMIPPNVQAEDVRAYQNSVNNALVTAVQQAGVKHAVVLSSIGADKKDKTGPVVGLYELEQKLNAISGLNVLHVRAGYFMENTLAQAGIIHAMGKTAGPLQADLKVPMIATRDIGAAAAEALISCDFKGSQARELLGQRDISVKEVTSIIAKAISKPDLDYIQLPDAQLRPALQQMGMSGSMADLLLEMSGSLNSGYMKALEPRSAKNTTPTSFETFVKEEFLPAFQGKSRAA
ncbi:MAG: NmrA family NAD(P)-binding protein [Acidobacteriia bacterium]|nr:NmrA family NAD(P)-binding protein [Terriglobia bacterium]